MKAFYPGKPPFPLLHVDTTWKFREMYAFRDRMAAELGLELLVHINQEGARARASTRSTHGSAGPHRRDEDRGRSSRRSTQHGFDAAFGGARRDEEKSRAKERVFSFRSAQHRWDPKNQRPELWHLYNARKRRGEIDPRLPALELDRARRLAVHRARGASRSCRSTSPPSGRSCERDGTLLMVDDDRMPLEAGETARAAAGALPHARLLPADRRGRERRRRRSPTIVEEMRASRDLRARGPRDRPRRRRLDGEEEAGGVLLSAVREQSLLRFITCGSVDDGKSHADRPPAATSPG